VSLSEFASQYAPALADIARQLEEHDAVICGCSAGPQKPDAPDQRQLPRPLHSFSKYQP